LILVCTVLACGGAAFLLFNLREIEVWWRWGRRAPLVKRNEADLQAISAAVQRRSLSVRSALISRALEDEITPLEYVAEIVESQGKPTSALLDLCWLYGWGDPERIHEDRHSIVRLNREKATPVLRETLRRGAIQDVDKIIEMSGAAKLLGYMGGDECFEDIEKLLTERLTGRFFSPHYARLTDSCLEALAVLGRRVSPRAREFLRERVDLAKWADIDFEMYGYDKEWTQAFLATKATNAIVLDPQEATAEALREVRDKYRTFMAYDRIQYVYAVIDNRIRLCEGYIASGDSLDEYYSVLISDGIYKNKYVRSQGIAGESTGDAVTPR